MEFWNISKSMIMLVLFTFVLFLHLHAFAFDVYRDVSGEIATLTHMCID